MFRSRPHDDPGVHRFGRCWSHTPQAIQVTSEGHLHHRDGSSGSRRPARHRLLLDPNVIMAAGRFPSCARGGGAMGRTVDAGSHPTCVCRGRADARGRRAGAALHFSVEAVGALQTPCRDDAWKLSVVCFEGDHWDCDEGCGAVAARARTSPMARPSKFRVKTALSLAHSGGRRPGRSEEQVESRPGGLLSANSSPDQDGCLT